MVKWVRQLNCMYEIYSANPSAEFGIWLEVEVPQNEIQTKFKPSVLQVSSKKYFIYKIELHTYYILRKTKKVIFWFNNVELKRTMKLRRNYLVLIQPNFHDGDHFCI